MLRHLAPIALCAGCVGGQATDLVPEGPPEIRQLMTVERFRLESGLLEKRYVIGFGTHPDANPAEQHPVTTAAVADQRVRVVLDELLAGHTLEEVQCTAQVDDDAFSRFPADATLDDVARCVGDAETLARTCTGPRAICVRQSDGVPVGVLDRVNHVGQPRPDGVPDVVRVIDGAAFFRCTKGAIERDIPVDQIESHYQPAGSQQRLDIDDGFRGFLLLGPAVVLEPRGQLPTGSHCFPMFSAEVTDKSGERLCAGEPCVPGDTTAAAFDTEQIEVTQATPPSGTIGVPRNLEITLQTSVSLGAAPVVTVTPAAPLTVVFSPATPQVATIRVTAILPPQTAVTFSVTLRDRFNVGPPPLTLTYTTGGAPTSSGARDLAAVREAVVNRPR